MLFCGRAQELDQLTKRWASASNISDPKPQLVVLKAERGVGKTRLAMEFYRWLSENVDGNEASGYWPDADVFSRHSIDVNPDPRDCQYNRDIPYLWWGIRASDKSIENSIAGDAVASYDRFLAPHLSVLALRARNLSAGKEIFNVWADVAKGEIAGWSGYDTVMSVGEGLLKTVGILRGTLQKNSLFSEDGGNGKSLSRVDAALEDLESVFNPRSFTFAKKPGVILIDDAQFAVDDLGLAVFCEKLLHRAMTQSWPVLILVTHWKRDLSPDFEVSERSFAGIFRHGREGSSNDKGAASALSGGYLCAENVLEIDLSPVSDLSDALIDALPGLKSDQAKALLDHAGGNPRYLEQIIAFLKENEDFFEEYDPQNALTDEGLIEALDETHDLFKVVMRRLRDAPLEVQEAICLASMQGVRFVADIVDELAIACLGADRKAALGKAVDPFSMVSDQRATSIAEFSERLFYQVSEKRRRSLKSLSDNASLMAAFQEILQERLDGMRLEDSSDAEANAMILGLAAQMMQKSDPVGALNALANLAKLEQGRYAYEASVNAAERFSKLFAVTKPSLECLNVLAAGNCGMILLGEGRIDGAALVLEALVSHIRSRSETLNMDLP